MSGPYPLSRDTILYAEVVTGELQYRGLSELRDTVEHISRALITRNEDYGLKELDHAFEHIRRGGVESVQAAAIKIFFETLRAIRIPSFALKITGLEVPDKEEVRQLRMGAMQDIISGRSAKSTGQTWIDAIQHFRNCINKCHQLQDMFPAKAKVRYYILMLIFGIITTLSLILYVFNIRFF